ncbi:RluA family pseudouridine synthase [Lactobacillus sp. DCY120]|uniref:RNA pseudouridylate synthase n=1 Tax=Bombilactobacillus apium TaxID=2675299 RepID=A0A850R4G8_9LACO|nr:RluA family pseudouridine synthase [Bombilactobacillus apium]NVY96871.1 RluA family pseudouridine synthase [Bombilactobacillus apium]
MILERHFTVQNLPRPLSVRAALNYWQLPRKWQHQLRINRSILINHHYQSFNQLLFNGNRIDLALSADLKRQRYLPAPRITCQILYEDTDLLIVNKPAGIKTHPNQPEEKTTLFNELTTYLSQPPLMLHRLDMLTSGAIMVAKNPLIVPIIEAQLANKTLQRTYLAVVPYHPQMALQARITAPIGLDPKDRRKRRIDGSGLAARTDYRILQHNQQYALLQLQLFTGRTHQIRVHLQSIGCPILGDPLYSSQPAGRLYLHAQHLSYQLPFQKQVRTVFAATPASFYQLTQAY